MSDDQSHKLVIQKGEHTPLCGWSNWNQATADDSCVTCKRCLKKMGELSDERK